MDNWRHDKIKANRQLVHDVLPLLRGRRRLWHRSNISAFESISISGFISPNDGSLPSLYPGRPGHRVSWGRSIWAIHLFDFDTATIDDIIFMADKWNPFLSDSGAMTIWFEIDRTRLERDSLIERSAYPGGEVPTIRPLTEAAYIPMNIPHVEVWYRAPISVKALTDIYAVRNGQKPRRLVPIGTGAPALATAVELAARWEAEIGGVET